MKTKAEQIEESIVMAWFGGACIGFFCGMVFVMLLIVWR